MSNAGTLRAVDVFSRLQDVTPSKVQRLGRASSEANRYVVRDAFKLTELLQAEWTRHPFSFRWDRPQSLEVSGTTSSEPDEQFWRSTAGVLSNAWATKALQPTLSSSTEANLEPAQDLWETAQRKTARSNLATYVYALIAGQCPPERDWRLPVHKELRLSNLLLFSQPPQQETELTPDEKRYRELNQKYYNGTITEEERLQLGRVEAALDEADTNDPQLKRFTKDLSSGYDKLHAGLLQVNRILDDLLRE
jgi:hypothetical protein